MTMTTTPQLLNNSHEDAELMTYSTKLNYFSTWKHKLLKGGWREVASIPKNHESSQVEVLDGAAGQH